MVTQLPLVFDAPRRGKPPRHSPTSPSTSASQLLTEKGLPGFRAKQLSAHYFARLVDDPDQMTDLPADQRHALVEALLPTLMTRCARSRLTAAPPARPCGGCTTARWSSRC